MFLNYKKILLYRFRRKTNTLSAYIDLVTKIKNKIDQKQVVLGIFIDLKKAFDTVSHKLLLEKLYDIAVRGTAHKILTSYLSDRYQVVRIGDCQSDPQLITCGIPKGSILGPLLFLIYINDVHKTNLTGDITLYADDTSVFYYGHSLQTIVTQAQDDLNDLNDWFKYNLLTLNSNKTNFVIFSAKNKKID